MVHRENVSTDSSTSHKKLNNIIIATGLCELAKKLLRWNELTKSDGADFEEEWKRHHGGGQDLAETTSVLASNEDVK